MAAAQVTALHRHCCICNASVLSLKSYISLVVRRNISASLLQAETASKQALINEIETVVSSVIDTGSIHSCICRECIRRIRRINTLQKDREANISRVLDDYSRTHDKENTREITSTPKKTQKRPSEGTPSKTFSPSSRPTHKKRTALRYLADETEPINPVVAEVSCFNMFNDHYLSEAEV